MSRSKTLLLLLAVLLAASCATAPPPAVAPTGDDRFLADPRLGFTDADAATAKRFDAAWRALMARDDADARRRLDEIRAKTPAYAPAALAAAALDVRAGRLAEAGKTVDAILKNHPDYTAALAYRAEIAYREKRTRAAWEFYRALAARPDAPPFAAERTAALKAALLDELTAAARAASGDESVRLLREILVLDPAAVEPRVMLARTLLAQRLFDEARKELDPLLDSSPDRTEVQELLAEIDAGRGRYEEAIVRYERLVRRTSDPRFAQRLEQIKQEWSAANMPAHYRAALQSPELTRAQLAVLLYWNVPSVRFAQNLSSPPIAVDLEGIEGREEMIRAIAIGLYEVDPVTRLVLPSRVITADRFSKHLVRLLAVRRAACAQGQAGDKVLAACGITDPLTVHEPHTPISGAEALQTLQQVATVL